MFCTTQLLHRMVVSIHFEHVIYSDHAVITYKVKIVSSFILRNSTSVVASALWFDLFLEFHLLRTSHPQQYIPEIIIVIIMK